MFLARLRPMKANVELVESWGHIQDGRKMSMKLGTREFAARRMGSANMAQGLAVTLSLAASSCILPTRGQVVDTVDVRSGEGGSGGRRGQAEKDEQSERKRPERAGSPAFTREEASDRLEGRFCRTIRPIVRELRAVAGRHIRCISSSYVEAGYFGTTQDLAAHSFHNACFAGSRPHGEWVRYHERPIPNIRKSFVFSLRVGADSRIDLSRFGLVPSVFVFERARGVAEVEVRVSYVEPVLRSPTNLGHTLASLENGRDVPIEVQRSASQCRAYLCRDESTHTTQIISARVRAVVTLKGGSAEALRPTSINAAVRVEGAGKDFVIEPAQRINLASRFRPSREILLSSNACDSSAVAVSEPPPGQTPPCTTIAHHGVHATIESCRRIGQSMGVSCDVGLLSPDYDRDLLVYIDDGRRGSTMVDERGSGRGAQLGGVGSTWSDSAVEVPLVANAPATVSLEFFGVATSSERLRRVTLHVRGEHELHFDFRDVEIGGEESVNVCRGGAGGR